MWRKIQDVGQVYIRIILDVHVHNNTPKRYSPNRNMSSQAYKALVINFNLNVAHQSNCFLLYYL